MEGKSIAREIPNIICGSSDFKEFLKESDIFIDKTLLIKDVIDYNYKVYLITRPRRWGKSTNISMLKYFFTHELDKEKNVIENGPNKSLFEGGMIILANGRKKILQPLNITKVEKWEEHYKHYQGKFPVIALNFKDLKGVSYSEIRENLKLEMKICFENYGYNIEEDLRNDQEDAFLKKSLLILSKNLKARYGKKVFIFIDEYDAPINTMIVEILRETDENKKKLKTEEYQKTTRLFGILFGAAFKDNANLEKAVMTGIMRITKDGIFSEINNMLEDSVLTQDFSKHYGFTFEEVNTLLQFYQDVDKDYIIEWYNGYRIGGVSVIYNPWSVVNYLKNNRKTSWKDSGNPDIIQNIMITDEMQDELHQLLLEGNSFKKNITCTSSTDLQSIKGAIWPLLLSAGYLTLKEEPFYNNFSETYEASLIIPNKEIKLCYSDFLRAWILKKIEKIRKIDLSTIDIHNKQEVEKKYNEAITITKENMGKMNEAIFHHLITDRHLYQKGKGSHRISPELYIGKGYIDHIFYPIQEGSSNYIVIHVYKYTTKSQSLELVMDDAWWQIYERNYMKVSTKKNKFEVILRPVIILHNDLTDEISVHIEENKHTNYQAGKIVEYFTHTDIIKLLALDNKKRNKEESRFSLLELNQCKTLSDLILKVSNGSGGRIISADLKPIDSDILDFSVLNIKHKKRSLRETDLYENQYSFKLKKSY